MLSDLFREFSDMPDIRPLLLVGTFGRRGQKGSLLVYEVGGLKEARCPPRCESLLFRVSFNGDGRTGVDFPPVGCDLLSVCMGAGPGFVMVAVRNVAILFRMSPSSTTGASVVSDPVWVEPVAREILV